MKTAQIVVLGVALGAAGIAAYLMAGSEPPPPPPPQQQAAAPIDTVEILVAKPDINMGQVVSPNEMQWQIWPTAAASANFVRKSDRPDAIQQLTGSIARSPMVLGEPIREAKLIKANGSGFMAAILPEGKRAISTDITPETGAGGFILPNDHVDVILSRVDKDAEKTGAPTHTGEIILPNVRVLAIDQAVEEKNGQRVVVGKTATLELSPNQAEQLAVSRQLGSLTLALRSLIDARGDSTDNTDRRG